jgi:hypothetical protein
MVVPRKKTELPGAKINRAFRPIVAAFADYRDVTGGKMMSSYGLKVKRRVFAMFGRKQFVTKLPKARVDELVASGVGKHFDPGHGRLMWEWVVVAQGGPDWLKSLRMRMSS